MNKIILSFIFVILFFNVAFAQSSYEIEINSLFLKVTSISVNNDAPNFSTAIDYSIEIIKKRPDSFEAAYVIQFLDRMLICDRPNKLKEKFIELKKDYLPDIDNVDSNAAEKLLLMYILLAGYSETDNEDEAENNNKLGKEKLIHMLESSSDKNLEALALICLARNCIADSQKYDREFISKFPDHKAISLIELDKAFCDYYAMRCDYSAFISIALSLSEKYKNVITPFGNSVAIDCYSLITHSYVRLKNYEKAKEYLDMIKKEAPGYWHLAELEKRVSELKNKNDK